LALVGHNQAKRWCLHRNDRGSGRCRSS
jgi:hypothetical protein